MTAKVPTRPVETKSSYESRVSIPEEKRPLITFALFSYNQERFIRDAVEGALSQSYSPLEIILSDDCSSDQTYQVMCDMVHDYSGPHVITLSQNEKNLGIGEHVNKISGMANGKVIVMAAGDDISIARRVETIFKYWIENGKPSAIQSDYLNIDDQGALLDKHQDAQVSGVLEKFKITNSEVDLPFYRVSGIQIIGCSSCYAREVFEKFGPLKDVSAEDNIFSFRASLLNGILFVGDRLVKYRHHDNNVSVYRPCTSDPVEFEKKNIRMAFLHRYNLLENHFLDLELAEKDLKFAVNISDLKRKTRIKRHLFGVLSNWWELNIPQKVYYYYFLIIPHGNRVHRKWALKRLLPFQLFMYIRNVKSEKRTRQSSSPENK